MDLKITLETLLPIPYGKWWFATTYFCLFITSGFINQLICTMNKKQHLIITWILIILETVLPTFMLASMASSELALFIMLYLTGAYMRIYDPAILRGKHIGTCGAVICVLICASCVSMDFIGQWLPKFSSHARHFMDLSSCLTFMAAVCIFSAFRNMEMKNSKVINTVAAGTFGIYLLHAYGNEYGYMQHLIWIRCFHSNEYYYAPTGKLILHMLICCSLIFIAGSVVDFIYRNTIEKIFMKWWDMNCERWGAVLRTNKIGNRVKKWVKSNF